MSKIVMVGLLLFLLFSNRDVEGLPKNQTNRHFQMPVQSDSNSFRLVKIRGLDMKSKVSAAVANPSSRDHTKYSGSLARIGIKDPDILDTKKVRMFSLVVSSLDKFRSFVDQGNVELEMHLEHEPTRAVLVSCTGKTAKRLLEVSGLVEYISLAPTALNTETSINYMDLAVNRINAVHSNYPELTGQGIKVLIKEQRIDSSDIDLQARLFATGLENDIVSQHANFMATMIGGNGNTYHLGLGVAKSVSIGSTDFTNVFADDSGVLAGLSVSLQNHSYGFDIDNAYGAESQSYDHQSYNNPKLLHVFSAGNKGLEASEEGPYAGVEGYANLSGSVKMAKNTLTIGATDNLGNRDSRSSSGPAYDGRVKPDVIAYGQEGTSDAAALGTGLSALIQDWYTQNFDELPNSSLVKSAIICGAVASDDQINYRMGYGVMDGLRTMQILNNGQFSEGEVLKDQPTEFELTVPENISELRVAICWNDPPAEAGVDSALINDLDLTVVDPDDNIWRPWVLNHFPHIDSLAKAPIRMADHINNVELVTVPDPAAGVYSLEIMTDTEMSQSQTFSLAYWLEEKDQLTWTYPTSQDILLTNSPLTFRWDTSLTGTGKLEMRSNGEWQTLSESYDLSNLYFEWMTQDPIIQSQLRITTSDNTYLSEEFNVVGPVELEVGYYCEDRFKLIWEKDDLASQYRLYELVDGELTLHSTTTDTAIVFDKTETGLRFSIKPVYDYLSNYKSRTIDHTQQGVNCYYKSFVAELIDDAIVSNSIQLTSVEDIASVELVNWHEGQSNNLVSLSPEGNSELFYEDDEVMEGVNNYFAAIKLFTGEVFFTDSAAVYYAQPNTLLAFPNPIAQNTDLNILSGEEGAILQLLNSRGDLLHEEQLFFDLNEIEIGNLSPGIYILRLFKDSREVSYAKLVVAN